MPIEQATFVLLLLVLVTVIWIGIIIIRKLDNFSTVFHNMRDDSNKKANKENNKENLS